MKKFDKGYIYSALLSDFFRSLAIPFLFLAELFSDEATTREKLIQAVPLLVLCFVLIYLCLITYRILFYNTSGYELTENEIKCKRGVFFKKNSVLDYGKIHAINKKQSLIQRIIRVAVLTVDSGSTNTSHQAEIVIIEKEKTVDSLMNSLSALKEGGSPFIDKTPKEEVLLSDKDSLYHFSSGKKMLYSLINVVTTAIFTVATAIITLLALTVAKFIIKNDFLGTWGEYLLVSFAIALGAILILSLVAFVASVINSFVKYHDFNITKHGNNIEITYGLLEKHTNSFSYDRIKAIKITQSLVQRMLGFASIKLEVIGYVAETDQNNTEDIGILVPFCKYCEVPEILDKVLPDYQPSEKQTKSVSYFPFVSWFSLITGIVTGVVTVSTLAVMLALKLSSAVVFASVFSVLGVGIIAIIIKMISAALAYKINGISRNGSKITAFNGSFSKTVTVFMVENLISVERVTTPLRKKNGISTLVMHIKTNSTSNEIKVHIQKDSLSDELEKQLIF